MSEPRYWRDSDVVYVDGNWKYRVQKILFDKDGKIFYHCLCMEDDDVCNHCAQLGEYSDHLELLEEDEIVNYDEWADHDCNSCEHHDAKSLLNCSKKFEE